MVDDVQLMLTDINLAVSNDLLSLSEWEEGFLESVTDQARDKDLSTKQEKILVDLWNRARN